MPSGKFALTYTVKNESRLLPQANEYHPAAGCSRIYLFWDNTTDNAPELVAHYPQVVARKSFKPDELHDPPTWLAQILPAWDIELDVRKIANTYYAAQQAAKDGLEWLICIDADELILTSTAEQQLENHIPRCLEQIPEDIDQLLLPNLESVPTAAETDDPFIDCVYFLNRFPATETLWRYSRAALLVNASPIRPKMIAWYDWLFYELRFAGALKRMTREPGTQRRIPARSFSATAVTNPSCGLRETLTSNLPPTAGSRSGGVPTPCVSATFSTSTCSMQRTLPPNSASGPHRATSSICATCSATSAREPLPRGDQGILTK